MELRDILPDNILSSIRDRYISGVQQAIEGFPFNSGDEDSLTGALGQAILTPNPIFSVGSDGKLYGWQVYHRKVRGRGPGAPERSYGSDGIFQIEATNEFGEILIRKGLPFQSKKEWTGTDSKLAAQSSDMLRHFGDGLVIDYDADRYEACSAGNVVEAAGRKETLRKRGSFKPLGRVLGNDFLECRVGREGLYYDPIEEEFLLNLRRIPAQLHDVIETKVIVHD